MQGPFTYEALPPKDISFVPLKQTRPFNAEELMQYYLDNDQKLKKFVPIIKASRQRNLFLSSQVFQKHLGSRNTRHLRERLMDLGGASSRFFL
jgi:hypothetical protein